jgi:hypothetical protein
MNVPIGIYLRGKQLLVQLEQNDETIKRKSCIFTRYIRKNSIE